MVKAFSAPIGKRCPLFATLFFLFTETCLGENPSPKTAKIQIAIFAGGLGCFAKHLKTGTYHFLRSLVADDERAERRVRCMRRRGQQIFARHLSLREGGGVLDALLDELDVSPRLATYIAVCSMFFHSNFIYSGQINHLGYR